MFGPGISECRRRCTHDGICDRVENPVGHDQGGDGPPVKVVVVECAEAEQQAGRHSGEGVRRGAAREGDRSVEVGANVPVS